MPTNRPIVLTIAGLDPCGGAGILADCKTFERLKTYGLAIATANTLQTENNFAWIQWQEINRVLESVEMFLKTYDIKAIKIGITPDYEYLLQIVSHIKSIKSEIKLVWDPVITASTNFTFIADLDEENLYQILQHIDLITPNFNEIDQLLLKGMDKLEKTQKLSQYTSVLLKGGHHKAAVGLDYLIHNHKINYLEPKKQCLYAKHGSGCVLSAAITANLAKGNDMLEACIQAKRYIEKILESNSSLLAYHDI